MSTNSERTSAYEWGFEKGEQAERERVIKLISHELGVMERAGGATFGRMPNFDEGYNAGMRDIAILIKGENK